LEGGAQDIWGRANILEKGERGKQRGGGVGGGETGRLRYYPNEKRPSRAGGEKSGKIGPPGQMKLTQSAFGLPGVYPDNATKGLPVCERLPDGFTEKVED